MNSQEKQSSPPKSNKKSSITILLPLGMAVIAMAVVYFFWFNTSLEKASETTAAKNSPVVRSTVPVVDSSKTASPGISVSPAGETASGAVEKKDVVTTATSSDTLQAPEVNTDKKSLQLPSPEKAPQQLQAFFHHLDRQSYLRELKVSPPSQQYFAKLIQKLVDNPPVVTRETDDLYTVLKNTAHFYRICGKENILILKGILDQEKKSFEDVLAQLYALSFKPEILKSSFSIDLPPSALYDYAGFFLNTMGGKLYLFRRDSLLRMVVNYYALLIIDDANRENRNSHGIDILPHIDGLINEIENSGNQLKYKEHYLDTLYKLKEKRS